MSKACLASFSSVVETIDDWSYFPALPKNEHLFRYKNTCCQFSQCIKLHNFNFVNKRP